MMPGFRRALALTLAALVGALVASAQSTSVRDLGIGKVLVAPRQAPDPNFAETVILLVRYDEEGVVGLTVNRRTKVPISRVFRDLKGAKDRADPVYAGGPVQMGGVLALLRSHAQPDDAPRVFGDIYLVSARPLLEKTLAAGTGPGDFRVYLGYCGWTEGQLQREVRLGAWYIFSGNSDLVFDSDVASVWPRLIAQTEQQIARFPASRR
jgi:putative transcriptional regulator